MEKPFILFNLRKGVNHIRYHYFYGHLYPYYANIQNTFFITFIIVLIDYLIDGTPFIGFPSYPLILGAIGGFITYIVIRIFYTGEQQRNYTAYIGVGLYNSLLSAALYSLFFINLGSDGSSAGVSSSSVLITIMLFAFCALIYFFLYAKVGRITIYPDRIVVDDRVFMLKDILKIKIHCGKDIGDFPDEYAGYLRMQKAAGKTTSDNAADSEKLVFLTPLHFIDSYEDIEIMHYYVFLHYNDGKIYVIQPMTYRNHFAGNARNAWIEDWRWDGKLKEPPEGWVSRLKKGNIRA